MRDTLAQKCLRDGVSGLFTVSVLCEQLDTVPHFQQQRNSVQRKRSLNGTLNSTWLESVWSKPEDSQTRKIMSQISKDKVIVKTQNQNNEQKMIQKHSINSLRKVLCGFAFSSFTEWVKRGCQYFTWCLTILERSEVSYMNDLNTTTKSLWLCSHCA